MLHVRAGTRLLYSTITIILKQNIALIPPIRVALHRHQRRLAACQKGPLNGRKIDRKIGISVQDKELEPKAARPASARRRFPTSFGQSCEYDTDRPIAAPSPTTASICSPRYPAQIRHG